MTENRPKLEIDRRYMREMIEKNGYTIKSMARCLEVSTNTLSSFLNRKIKVFKAESIGEFLLLTNGSLDDIAYYVDSEGNRMSREDVIDYLKNEEK